MTAPLPGQDHVDWTSPQIQEVVDRMKENYPGGIAAYVNKGKQLLKAATSSASTSGEEEQEKEKSSNKKLGLKMPPHVEHIDVSSKSTEPLLRLGNQLAGSQTAFVLVAGGLGERLGAKSIKLSLPIHSLAPVVAPLVPTEGNVFGDFPDAGCFLHHYISWMIYCSKKEQQQQQQQQKEGEDQKQEHPLLIIMTSDDTDAATKQLLDRNDNFGMRDEDIILVKQPANVPCLSDVDAKLSVSEDRKSFVTKPHGHGDIHRVLLSAKYPGGCNNNNNNENSSSSLLTTYLRDERNIRFIVFMQDTNSGATTTIPYSLAVMEQKKWSMVFTCVPRLPGEAIGALVEANNNSSSRPSTYCIEYNVLDDLLKKEGFPEGDTKAPGSEFSAFPGTINTLLLRLDDYIETVTRTHGVIAEFINPKWKDAKLKTEFKSPARLETLMQDISLELNPEKCLVGACVFPRKTYFPVKNALADGIAKWKSMGIDPHNASQGEGGYFLLRRLSLATARPELASSSSSSSSSSSQQQQNWALEKCVPPPPPPVSAAVEESCGKSADVCVDKQLPVVIFPIFYSTHALDSISCSRQFPASSSSSSSSSSSRPISITRRSSLVLLGDVIVHSLNLDGALVVNVPKGIQAIIDLQHRPVRNAGWICSATTTTTTSSSGSQQEQQQQQEEEGEKEGMEKTVKMMIVEEAEKIRGFHLTNRETDIASVPASMCLGGPSPSVVRISQNKETGEFVYEYAAAPSSNNNNNNNNNSGSSRL